MRFTLLVAGMASLLLQACGSDGTGPRTGEMARLRLASSSPDIGALDLLVNGKTIAHAVGRTEASTPTEVEPGQVTGEVRATGTSAALASLPLTLDAGESYTVLVAGPAKSLTAIVSVDTAPGAPLPPPGPVEPVDSGNPPPAVEATRFRILHAAPHAPPLDPYLLPIGAALDTLPSIQPFAYGSLALTGDLIRGPGRYTVRFTAAGTKRVVLESSEIEAALGDLLIVVLGENADRSLRVDVVRE